MDPALFSAIASGLAVVGSAWTGWLAYRLKLAAMAHEIALAGLHDCLDAHRQEVQKASATLDTLAARTIVMHGQNQAAIAETQAAVQTLSRQEAQDHGRTPSQPAG